MTAKDAIKKEFMQLYRQKDVHSITVKELCMKTPVARTTFYTYYQNIDEVLNEIEDYLVLGILQIAIDIANDDVESMDFSLFLTHAMQYIKNNWDEIQAFLIVQPNMRFIHKWKDAIKKHFSLRFPEKVHLENYELIAETIASGVIGAYSYWLKYPQKVNVEKIDQIIVSMLYHTIQLL